MPIEELFVSLAENAKLKVTKPTQTGFTPITCSACERGECLRCTVLFETRMMLRRNASANKDRICVHDCAGLGAYDPQ